MRLFADSEGNQQQDEEILERVQISWDPAERQHGHKRGGVGGGAFADLLFFPLTDEIQMPQVEKTW